MVPADDPCPHLVANEESEEIECPLVWEAGKVAAPGMLILGWLIHVVGGAV